MADIVRFVDSIPPDVLADGFGHPGTGGWGALDGATPSMRPRWGVDSGNAPAFSVLAGTGRVSMTTLGVLHAVLVSARMVEFDQTVTVGMPTVATGGPIYLGLYGLYVDTASNYKAELVLNPGGVLDIRIRRADSGTTTLSTATVGLYSAGQQYKIRFQRVGSTWRAKVWLAAAAQPAAWATTAVDTPRFAFGRVGCSAILDAANTNATPVLVQFDDYSCIPAPSVRLDLSDNAPWRVLHEGADLSPPPLRRAIAQTLLRDGAVYPASAYDDRVLQLRFGMYGLAADDGAAAMLALAREVDRPTNVLMWQPEGMSYPIFFRTIRSELSHVEELSGPGDRVVSVQLLAEPFGYGAQQILPSTIVGNDPNGAGQQFDLTGVLGDVDTPVVLRLDAAAVAGRQTLIATRRRSLDGIAYELQAESGVTQTDATKPGNDAVMSGTGSNYVRVSFATDITLANRINFTQYPVGSPTTAYRGRYRAFLRYRKSVAGDVIRVRLRWGGFNASDSIQGQIVTLAASTERRYADLGVVSLPPGTDPMREGYSGLLWPASGVAAALQAERLSGAGTLDLDALVFVPADERSCYVSWPAALTGYGVVDGIAEMAYEQSTDSAGTGPGPIGDALAIPVIGLFPTLSPGVTNRVYALQNIGITGAQDAIGDSVEVNATYWPRYLYVRPPSS